jgi:cobaltochelatase CobT
MGAEVEVLGFTTLHWKGGQSRRDWIEAGKPTRPGRLNDLLHIIYKEPDHPWQLSVDGPSPRQCLDRIYRVPYLREGIDGEAVEWATARLAKRGRDVKILLTMSDCAPVDDATMSVNPPEMLRDHLKVAVASAEAAGITVLAIDNGRPNAAEDPLYDRIAYAGYYRSFDDRKAAAAALHAVAEIVAPRVTPSP